MTVAPDPTSPQIQLGEAIARLQQALLAARTPAGPWVGELSSSALSTATACSALALVAQHRPGSAEQATPLTARGIAWLAAHQNDDGGWGDTDRSLSNIATTLLVCAAMQLTGAAGRHRDQLDRARRYIDHQGGLDGLRRRYGKDKTFAVPILTNLALAGMADWHDISPLPFEMACLPHATLKFLRLPVVSYALPALVAIGQARHFQAPSRNPLVRWLRQWAVPGSLRVLRRMQPTSGGFLEATPLTSFVVMSLAGTGRADHDVVTRGLAFLVDSVRNDGSWPIDTNLATWNTTLAINALAATGAEVASLGLVDWLLSCQHRRVHPFTQAAAGGWGWSDLDGAVPDADDTCGALLALAALARTADAALRESIESAAATGLGWLLDMQNHDGGWPTFCRGWGALPFDRSGTDLTAHALRAIAAWQGRLPGRRYTQRFEQATARGLRYLANQQKENGSWLPLWFGNHFDRREENPYYGTGRVLLAYRDLNRLSDAPASQGIEFLLASQGSDGSWGGPLSGQATSGGSVEETAIAIEALAAASDEPTVRPAFEAGLRWLVTAIEANRWAEATPIGFYFARLWYYEKMYPLVFALAALGRAREALTAG